ncbi:hypothetical protein ADP71_01210 [Vitreoscilla sp. C1]|nr:hypothetical protein ADP71_01210 [Vitreoscilla sp. C1]
MYHCKIAHTKAEFAAIARLNYQTFVEEIPQHSHNAHHSLTDAFHEQNTYLLCYQDENIIAMLAFRDQRPFSLDKKIGAVEALLNPEQSRKLCELRLLAMEPEYRHSLAFFHLIQAMYHYLLDQDYSACVISGTTRQQKLYRKIGFEAFAPEVGSEQARFVPMVLTADKAHLLFERLPKQAHIFYPGPVQQTHALTHTDVSHRSSTFVHLHKQVTQTLLSLSQAQHVALLLGSGTLANAVMLQQLQQRHGTQKGLICSNGEFGQRLQQQAQALGLVFETYNVAWGESFTAETLDVLSQNCAWVACVHGETSCGHLNDLDMFVQNKHKQPHTLAVDCISSFGALPFSLTQVDFASATSGKAIGALAGLSWVFYQQNPTPHPHAHTSYTDLNQYHHQTPFTLPVYLLANLAYALEAYPQRFEQLHQRLQMVLKHKPLQAYALKTQAYPTAINFQLPALYTLNAPLNGLFLHNQSAYLKAQQWSQISVIQPDFEADFAALSAWLQHLHSIDTNTVTIN